MKNQVQNDVQLTSNPIEKFVRKSAELLPAKSNNHSQLPEFKDSGLCQDSSSMQLIEVSQIIEVEGLKTFYDDWTDLEKEDMISSLETHGQKVPAIINKDNILIDGYRRKFCLEKLGIDGIWVIVKDCPPALEERIIHNKYRVKTTNDLVKEIKSVFEKFPKKQGKKNLEGKYTRHEVISNELGSRWKGDKTLKKVEEVMENDLEGDTLLKGIVSQKWSVDKCHEYVEKWKKIDETNNFGFTERLKKGELSISETCKLIESRHGLDKYQDTFIIPNKSISFNMDCTLIKNMKDFFEKVALIFTSIPYYRLRFYENGEGFDQANLGAAPLDPPALRDFVPRHRQPQRDRPQQEDGEKPPPVDRASRGQHDGVVHVARQTHAHLREHRLRGPHEEGPDSPPDQRAWDDPEEHTKISKPALRERPGQKPQLVRVYVQLLKRVSEVQHH
jgi:hypothetical protein